VASEYLMKTGLLADDWKGVADAHDRARA